MDGDKLTIARVRCPDTGRIHLINKDTGEPVDYEEKTIPKRHTYETKRFFMVDQEPREEFLKEHLFKPKNDKKALNFTDIKVLLYIETIMKYGNIVSFTQASVSENTGIARPNISKSFKRLLETGYIVYFEPDRNDLEYSGDKRQKHYIINPNILWKGKPKERKKAISEYRPKNGNVIHASF